MKRVGLIGCTISNLGSVKHAVDSLGFDSIVITNAEQVAQCSHLILPGVGSFAFGMNHLQQQKLIEPLTQAYQNGKPILGICLGMQLFSSKSNEFGEHSGLNLISDSVKRLNIDAPDMKLPHMGWNRVTYQKSSLLFKDIPQNSFFYFAHSYAYCNADNPYVTSHANYYDTQIVTTLEKNNLYGVQFHPEKSQKPGLQLLNNFLNLC